MDNLDETKHNEIILRLFYDMPFIGMAITSPVTKRWVKFNDRLCEILGYSREELSQITWTEITHPDDLELDVAHFERVMRGESEGYVMDKRFIRKDGSVIDAAIDVKCIRREDRSIDFFVATIQDISDRKLAEAKQKQSELAIQKLNDDLERQIKQRTADLSESEARNFAIIHALPDLLLLLKPDGTCLDCIMPSSFDRSKYIPIENHISEVLSPEIIDSQLHLYKKAIATGELQSFEHQLSKFGQTVYEEVRIAPYGKDALLVIVRDISDRRLAEERLLKSDTHLKLAQRISKLGSWEFDLRTEEVIWSEEVFRIFGRDPAIGTPTYPELKKTVHPDDWEYFDQVVQNAIATCQSYEVEYRIYWADGRLIYVLARGEIICDLMGKAIQVVGTVLDISDRKLAEAKILYTSDQLANTNRELESFSYSVSHDLRAPLRHMNGFVNALQQRLKNHEALNDPKVTHYLQVIEKSSQKMGHLIDGLLTLSRFGRRPLESKQISIRDLVDEAIEIIRTDPSYNPLVEFAIGDLPTIVGDPALLQQVFRNLIGNAVKFSRNHPQPYIEIDSLPDQIIRIRDNGVGFQMEYADKLFGAFQRLHNDKEFEGTGIGLAIVQRIVQRHGGSIWAEGYPDQGATFFIKL
jgi:PAS domain S-box-containing protein